ncbi:hypothetical protein RB599_010279 [Gaeumannomyces hyphopodioides]
MSLDALRAEITLTQNTDVTKTVHTASYPAISSLRPELSQEGRTVLITGGGTGCGLAIAKAFVAARAARVVILGRREGVLSSAHKELEDEARRLSSPAVIVHRIFDVTNEDDVEKLWADAEVGFVDVFVSNAARFQTEAKPLVELGYKEVWSSFEANVRGPLHMAEKFQKQKAPAGKQNAPKSLVNVSTAAIHMFDKSVSTFSVSVPSYGLSKNAGTLALQLVAADVEPAQLQVVSFHPGTVHTEVFQRDIGVGPRDLPFDDAELSGSFAVWAASPEARFLHGRFVWASWDVEELATGPVRKRMEEDHDFLRVGVVGLKFNKLASHRLCLPGSELKRVT